MVATYQKQTQTSASRLLDRLGAFTRIDTVIALAGRDPYFLPIQRLQGAKVLIDGRWILMGGSSDYLGLGQDRRVRKAARDALRVWGPTSSGTRLLSGHSSLLGQLEEELADFLGKEAVCLFPSGFVANASLIAWLAGTHTMLLVDRAAHASIYEGCYTALGQTLQVPMGHARLKRFRHNDVADLERLLCMCPSDMECMVMTDGVFSMTGDYAPLLQIVELCQRYGATLVVDEAHALGVAGAGRGTAALLRVTDLVPVLTGSLSKAFAACGGFVAGDRDLVRALRYQARTVIFSAGIAPPTAAAALAALHIIRDEPERARDLMAQSFVMREALRSLGIDVGLSATAIVPLHCEDEARMFAAWRALWGCGVYLNPVVAPAVPPGSALLRLICSAPLLAARPHTALLKGIASAWRQAA